MHGPTRVIGARGGGTDATTVVLYLDELASNVVAGTMTPAIAADAAAAATMPNVVSKKAEPVATAAAATELATITPATTAPPDTEIAALVPTICPVVLTSSIMYVSGLNPTKLKRPAASLLVAAITLPV